MEEPTRSPSSSRLPKAKLVLIDHDELHQGELIGTGGFGAVYRGQYESQPVAIKQLHHQSLAPDMIQALIDEAKVMGRLSSPHVLPLLGVCLDKGHYALVMPYQAGGSLYQSLHDAQKPLPWDTFRAPVIRHLLNGLAYLHDYRIVHRDIKSPNVLLDADGNARLSDFGLAKVKLDSRSHSTTQSGSSSIAGSTRWLAPELFKRGAKPTFASDVYALGMTVWELASRQVPFQEADQEMVVMMWIKDGEQEKIPQDCPQPWAELIKACWTGAEARPTASALLKQWGADVRYPPIKRTPPVKRVSRAFPKQALPPQPLIAQRVKTVKPHEYTLGRVIKSGQFGTVYQGQFDGQSVAIKALAGLDGSEAVLAAFKREGLILAKCDSPYVVRLHAIGLNPLVMIMEYCAGGDLEVLLKNRSLSAQERQQYAHDVAQGLAYLHGQGIVHGDVALRNVLLKAKGSKQWQGCLTDVGLSRVLKASLASRPYYQMNDDMKVPWAISAPEVLSSQEADTPSDLYSYGSLLLGLVTGKRPYDQERQANEYDWFALVERIKKGYREKLPDAVPAHWSSLIQACWAEDPAQRPQAEAVLKRLEAKPSALEQARAVYAKAEALAYRAQYRAAKPLFEEAAQGGYVAGWVWLYRLYNVDGRIGPKHPEQAKACAAQVKAQWSALEAQANAEDASAQWAIGYAYDCGCGVTQDFSKAIMYLRLSAEQGHAQAQFNLGVCYDSGEGVTQDQSEAVRYCRLAADQGVAQAQYNLGWCYANGEGVKQDWSEAVRYYRLAADQGEANAQVALKRLKQQGVNTSLGASPHGFFAEGRNNTERRDDVPEKKSWRRWFFW